jgi:hypothetical protein
VSTPAYALVYHPHDHERAIRIAQALERRDFRVERVLSSNATTARPAWYASFDVIVLFAQRDERASPTSWLPEGTRLENIALVVPKHLFANDSWTSSLQGCRFIVDDGRFDRLLLDVLFASMPPLPSWLDCRINADVTEPTGVAWWNSDLLVCDTARGAVLRLGLDGSTGFLLPGLSEPHHLHLDRRLLYVANTGDNRILSAEYRPNEGLASIRDASPAEVSGLTLNRPHGVAVSDRILAIADTNNHRILVGSLNGGDVTWSQPSDSHVDAFNYPCGVTLVGSALWVTNSYIGAVDYFDLAAPKLGWARFQPGDEILVDPNAVAHWNGYMFIADEVRQSLVMARWTNDRQQGLFDFHDVARHWISSPFGLSVNVKGRLAIADRLRGVMWILDIPRYLSADEDR